MFVPQETSIPPAPSEPRGPAAPPRYGMKHHVLGLLGGALLGMAVAIAGTLVHRQWYPMMLVAALAATLSAGVWAVSWRRAAAGAGYVSLWCVTTLILASHGPGGDVLIAGASWGAAPVAAGLIWMNAGTVCAAAPLLLCGRWGSRIFSLGIRNTDSSLGEQPSASVQETASHELNGPGYNYAGTDQTSKHS
ncbi:hypothetical protein SAMN06309944_2355 [Micrococcales bacterium KH10]|nr:hypothetical protein SAMN06309944_2355 [Micrococcales bacterium KH10]